jgi:hypothetical protein
METNLAQSLPIGPDSHLAVYGYAVDKDPWLSSGAEIKRGSV